MTISSPCIDVCVIDPKSGLCKGCARTVDEIAAWSPMSETARRRVMDGFKQRRTANGL